jgi:hypothetical protein
MIKQVFLSDILPYEHYYQPAPGFYPSDNDVPLTPKEEYFWRGTRFTKKRPGKIFTSVHYMAVGPLDNQRNPLRRWAQSVTILGINFMEAVPKTTPTGDFVIWVVATVATDYWPAWDIIGWEIDGATGEFIRFTDSTSNMGTIDFRWAKMGRNLQMIVNRGFVGFGNYYSLHAVNPNNGDPFGNGTEIDLTRFVGWDNNFICFDIQQDVALIVTSDTPPSCISVHHFSTGELIRHVPASGMPVDAHWEDQNRAYVVSSTGVITLIDFVTGETMSATQLDLPGNPWKTGYDRFLKRLLFIERTPDAYGTGASTLRVKGYRNLPVETRITKPVPLARPRVGSRTPFVARIVGSIGESIGGPNVTASLDNGNGTLIDQVCPSDGYGYTRFNVTGVTAGAGTLTLSCNGSASTFTTPSYVHTMVVKLDSLFYLGKEYYLPEPINTSYIATAPDSTIHDVAVGLAQSVNQAPRRAVSGYVTGDADGEVQGTITDAEGHTAALSGNVDSGFFFGFIPGGDLMGHITGTVTGFNGGTGSGTLVGDIVTASAGSDTVTITGVPPGSRAVLTARNLPDPQEDKVLLGDGEPQRNPFGGNVLEQWQLDPIITGPNIGTPKLWNGTHFVAVNGFGRSVNAAGPLWLSTDGLNYTQMSYTDSEVLFDVLICIDGRYFGSRQSPGWVHIYYSDDLMHWTKGEFGIYPSGTDWDSGSVIVDIIKVGSTLVALRKNNEIMTSTDNGATWVHRINVVTPLDLRWQLTNTLNFETLSIAYGNGVCVVIGSPGIGGSPIASNHIFSFSSFDGPVTETIYPYPIPKDICLYQVRFIDGYFYAIGARLVVTVPPYLEGYSVAAPWILRGTNGVDWTDVTPYPALARSEQMKGSDADRIFRMDSGLFVIVGWAMILTSPDGITWTEHPRVGFEMMGGASNGTIIALKEHDWTDPIPGALYQQFIIRFNMTIYDPATEAYTPPLGSIYDGP